MANNIPEAQAHWAAPGPEPTTGSNGPGVKARRAGPATGAPMPVLDGYTPLVRPGDDPRESGLREWLAVADAHAQDPALETAPIPTQQPGVLPPRRSSETAPIPILRSFAPRLRQSSETTPIPIQEPVRRDPRRTPEPPGATVAQRVYETAPIPLRRLIAPTLKLAPEPAPRPAPAAPGRWKAYLPVLERLGYLFLCVLVLFAAGGLARRGGGLEAIFAPSTPTPRPTPLPVTFGLLGTTPTPGVPTPAAATPLPSPQAAPTLAPTSVESTPVLPAGAPPIEEGKSLTVEDVLFAGGEIPPQRQYRGRSARLLPAPTLAHPQRNELRIEFNLNIAAEGPVRRAALTLVGVDSPDEVRSPILITLNDRQVYTGPSPLDDDSPTGSDADANWSSYTRELDPALLRQGPNQLVLANLATTGAENFIVIDFAEITWTP